MRRIGGAPAGFRAAQLPDANVTSDFLHLFGKPQRMEACECERDNDSNMMQALHFINGKSILGRVQNPAARATLVARQKLNDRELVTELYLWSVARHPSEAELKVTLEFFRRVATLPVLGASTAGLAGSPAGRWPLLAATAVVDGRITHAQRREEAAQDLMWALLNSRDFLLSH